MSRVFTKNVLESIKKFGISRYGSLQGLADAMGVRPQNLNSYLSGARNFGNKYIQRLENLGFVFDSDNTTQNNTNKCLTSNTKKVLDILGAIELSNTTEPRLAQLMGIDASTLSSWSTGTATPSMEQVVNLFNLTVALGLSARHAPPKPLDTAETNEPMPPAQATA